MLWFLIPIAYPLSVFFSLIDVVFFLLGGLCYFISNRCYEIQFALRKGMNQSLIPEGD